MKHSVPHDLGKDRAKAAAVAAFDSYSAKFARYDPAARWVTDDRAEVSFRAKGIALTGSLEVKDGSIDVDVDVPFLLRPFKDKALSAVEREIRSWVDKAKRGEL